MDDDIFILLAVAAIAYGAWQSFGSSSSSSDTAAPTGSGAVAVSAQGLADILANYSAPINDAANSTGLAPALIAGVIATESGGAWPPPVGDGGAARGLMQMHQPACQDIGADWSQLGTDPAYDIAQGAAYLALCSQRVGGDQTLMLIAYNQGASVALNSSDPRYATGLAYAQRAQNYASLAADQMAASSSSSTDPLAGGDWNPFSGVTD